MAAEGRVQFVAVVQGRRRAEDLEATNDGVTDHMHQGDHPPTQADLHEDQRGLGHGGIGEHALEISLGLAHKGGVQGCAAPDHDQSRAGQRCLVEQRLAPQQHVGPGVDRQGPVEDRARGCGSFHGAGQPAGERHLSGLAQGREHEQEADHSGGRRRHEAGPVRPIRAEHPIKVAGPDGAVDHNAGHENADVANPIGGEGPECRPDRVAAFVEEADQQGRRDANTFPAREQDVDAVGEHHQVHPGAEEGEQDEESREARLPVEVLPGEGVHEPDQAARETDVGHREGVGHKMDRGLVMADGEPRHSVDDLRSEVAGREDRERRDGGQEAGGKTRPHQPRRGALVERAAEECRQADHRERRSGRRELDDHEARDQVVSGHAAPPARRRSSGGRAAITLAGGMCSRWPRYHSTDRSTTARCGLSGV